MALKFTKQIEFNISEFYLTKLRNQGVSSNEVKPPHIKGNLTSQFSHLTSREMPKFLLPWIRQEYDSVFITSTSHKINFELIRREVNSQSPFEGQLQPIDVHWFLYWSTNCLKDTFQTLQVRYYYHSMIAITKIRLMLNLTQLNECLRNVKHFRSINRRPIFLSHFTRLCCLFAFLLHFPFPIFCMFDVNLSIKFCIDKQFCIFKCYVCIQLFWNPAVGFKPIPTVNSNLEMKHAC